MFIFSWRKTFKKIKVKKIFNIAWRIILVSQSREEDACRSYDAEIVACSTQRFFLSPSSWCNWIKFNYRIFISKLNFYYCVILLLYLLLIWPSYFRIFAKIYFPPKSHRFHVSFCCKHANVNYISTSVFFSELRNRSRLIFTGDSMFSSPRDWLLFFYILHTPQMLCSKGLAAAPPSYRNFRSKNLSVQCLDYWPHSSNRCLQSAYFMRIRKTEAPGAAYWPVFQPRRIPLLSFRVFLRFPRRTLRICITYAWKVNWKMKKLKGKNLYRISVRGIAWYEKWKARLMAETW